MEISKIHRIPKPDNNRAPWVEYLPEKKSRKKIKPEVDLENLDGDIVDISPEALALKKLQE